MRELTRAPRPGLQVLECVQRNPRALGQRNLIQIFEQTQFAQQLTESLLEFRGSSGNFHTELRTSISLDHIILYRSLRGYIYDISYILIKGYYIV